MGQNALKYVLQISVDWKSHNVNTHCVIVKYVYIIEAIV